MNQYFIYTLQKLENTNNAIAGFQTQACTIVSTTEATRLLDEIKLRIEICLDTRSKDEIPYYYLLAGYCYLFFEKFKEAEKYSAMAIDNFRICGMSWNEAIAHWFLGLIYRSEGRGYLYITELNKTLEIVSPILAEHQIQGNYTAAINSEEVIKALQEQRSFAAKMGTGPLHMPDEKNEGKEEVKNKGYLVVPWLPIYEQVQAGTNGPIWVELPKLEKMEIPLVLLQKQWHSLHSLRHNERQITLAPDRQYAWVRVHGDSMNKVKPVPIHDGDYVLFYKAQHPEQNEIVIAAVSENHGSVERAYIIKRYKKDEYILTSETSRKGKEYDPIPLTEDFQIIGIVIAVAKPKNQTNPTSDYSAIPKTKSGNQNEVSVPLMITKGMRQQLLNQGYSEDDISHMTPKQDWDNIDEDELFQNLLIKVLGDHEAANRLMKHEQSQHPRSSRKELIEFAILEWEKNNR